MKTTATITTSRKNNFETNMHIQFKSGNLYYILPSHKKEVIKSKEQTENNHFSFPKKWNNKLWKAISSTISKEDLNGSELCKQFFGSTKKLLVMLAAPKQLWNHTGISSKG